jgi:hypothetical protein
MTHAVGKRGPRPPNVSALLRVLSLVRFPCPVSLFSKKSVFKNKHAAGEERGLPEYSVGSWIFVETPGTPGYGRNPGIEV